MNDLKVVFMGTPDFAVPVLQALIDNTNVVMVVTQPDKVVGRKQQIKFSPIKELALKNNIKIFQPEKIKLDYKEILDMNPDIIITCAYGQIIPKVLLDTPRYKAINVHASLLPKLRGGAPIHHALIDGYDETGITIMYMAIGMDDGDIISQHKVPILESDNVGTLHDKLSILGAKLLIETLPSIIDGTNKSMKQNENEVTFAYNIKREEEIVDFTKSAKEVFNQIRGLYPFPTAYANIAGEPIKLLESHIVDNRTGSCGEITNATKDGITIKCSDISICVTRVKPMGKKEMSVREYLNGQKNNIKGLILNE